MGHPDETRKESSLFLLPLLPPHQGDEPFHSSIFEGTLISWPSMSSNRVKWNGDITSTRVLRTPFPKTRRSVTPDTETSSSTSWKPPPKDHHLQGTVPRYVPLRANSQVCGVYVPRVRSPTLGLFGRLVACSFVRPSGQFLSGQGKEGRGKGPTLGFSRIRVPLLSSFSSRGGLNTESPPFALGTTRPSPLASLIISSGLTSEIHIWFDLARKVGTFTRPSIPMGGM